MARDTRSGKSRTKSKKQTPPKPKPRKKPAYPKPGTGEDFPARRQGTKIGETRGGQSVKQPTRASQAAKSRKKSPFPTKKIPRAKRRRNPDGTFQAEPSQPWKGQDPRSTWPFSADVKGKPTKEEPWRL